MCTRGTHSLDHFLQDPTTIGLPPAVVVRHRHLEHPTRLGGRGRRSLEKDVPEKRGGGRILCRLAQPCMAPTTIDHHVQRTTTKECKLPQFSVGRQRSTRTPAKMSPQRLKCCVHTAHATNLPPSHLLLAATAGGGRLCLTANRIRQRVSLKGERDDGFGWPNRGRSQTHVCIISTTSFCTWSRALVVHGGKVPIPTSLILRVEPHGWHIHGVPLPQKSTHLQ